ncbi:GWxTD domain-containing protein [Balneolaceae bacterium YR4-1]|uniref:GWxTD domain-containing protein n=1 Tax=Halalkalibaculum roseum TaxID=2709311 RepID=A0A6M1SJV2_9BACT|nr:GWxTD domain-containing protein [Halalkalibaculum roseum]NGP75299.1 GWxTD domain-containing protein [Halalkalibaculum roseum]
MLQERRSVKLRFSLVLLIPVLLTVIPNTEVANAQTSSVDSLGIYINQANICWSAGESDLQLSVDLLSEVSKRDAQRFYQLATDFYYWSLRNADFSSEKETILSEFERIKPLLPDSLQKRWKELIENEDRQALQNIVGFWEINDPYVSTKENERLIEHWQRIHYARNNFTITKEPPYGTDERGVYYVRLGMPDSRTLKTLRLNLVIGPEGETFDFELGNVIQSDIEIWEYSELGDDFFLLFGERDGWGEYGLRKSPMELIPENIRVQLGASGFRNQSTMRKLSKNVAQYGVYQQLAPLHTHFSNMYSSMQTSLSAYSIGYSGTNKFIQAPFIADPLSRVQINNNLMAAPGSKTTAVTENGILSTQQEIYRFLAQDGKQQIVLALQPNPTNEHMKNKESLFLSNRISVYDKNWNLAANIEDPKKVTDSLLSVPSLYLLEEPLNEFNAFYSSELIDTTYYGVTIPGKVTQKASAIVSTTGRKKLTWPESFNKEDTLLISDIILGLEQEFDDARVPITPTLDRTFEPNTDLMVYFEAYNIPEEGYSFTYYFEKHRWLLGNKRPSDKPSVTIVNDKLNSDRNTQLFALSLSELGSGTYDLFFEFRPVGETGEDRLVRTRKIELVVD